MKGLQAKRLLIPLTLALLAPASAFAQSGGLERRIGDALVGPVHTARVETASYFKQDGALVEGPRRLSSSVTYSEDGKRREEESYAEDGTLRQRFVEVYDDAGRVIEQETYDGRGGLLAKVVARPDAGEVLTYGPDGKLLQRVVTARGEGGVTESKTYDASGALLKRGVSEDGANGAPAARRVASIGAGSGSVDVSAERPRGSQFEKTRVTREYDTRGNVVKSVSYVWDNAAGDFAPSSVAYYTVTYYR
jgi:hypothetical protein